MRGLLKLTLLSLVLGLFTLPAFGQIILVGPDDVTFPPTCGSAQKTITLENINPLPILLGTCISLGTINSIQFVGGDAADFSIINNPAPVSLQCIPLSPSAVDVTLAFTPLSPGTKSSTLVISYDVVLDLDNDTEDFTMEIPVTGEPATTSLNTFMSNSTFGSVCEGDSMTRTLTINNNGECEVTLTSITFDPANPDYSAPDVSGTVIPVGHTIDVTITYTPAGPGTDNTTLQLNSDAGTAEEEITGTGVGTQLQAYLPNAGNFGNVCLGDTKDMDLTLHNPSCGPVTISSITSAAPTVFVLPLGFTQTVLAGGETMTVPVRFQPSALGNAGPQLLTIVSDADTPGTDILVVMNGASPAANVIANVSPSSNFGDVCVGSYKDIQVTLSNNGGCDAYVSAIDITGTDPGEFSIQSLTFPIIVPPGHTYSFTVRYTPTHVGAVSADLNIHWNTEGKGLDNTTLTVGLSGNAPPVSLSTPGQIIFPPTVRRTLGACETLKPLNIVNNGNCPITIDSLDILGDGYDDYSLVNLPSLPVTLAPGAMLGGGHLMVSFHPDEIARQIQATIQITFETNDPNTPTDTVSVELCGEGVNTGARVLVRVGGSNDDFVELLKIQRITGNRNRKIVDTVDTAKNLSLTNFDDCEIDHLTWYHKEYGGESNQIQLLPGSYQVTATTFNSNGKKVSRTVGFDVNTCTFNPNVVIDIP